MCANRGTDTISADTIFLPSRAAKYASEIMYAAKLEPLAAEEECGGRSEA
jgi:hypothetical protein